MPIDYTFCHQHGCRRAASHNVVEHWHPEERNYDWCLDHAAERLVEIGIASVRPLAIEAVPAKCRICKDAGDHSHHGHPFTPETECRCGGVLFDPSFHHLPDCPFVKRGGEGQ